MRLKSKGAKALARQKGPILDGGFRAMYNPLALTCIQGSATMSDRVDIAYLFFASRGLLCGY
ncbi:hypothetical protein X474_06755 [Dethiosulfatarculus sandiegensis]|uniref:Uncharacterized protein n=1 Tax=Dethiosulfatarculus sandiegensis TaxID=1429043 RepID=A0A0D2J9M3_9BACT|nr:hypothetical protein X474_06755 [Dethiosulfatarculus sandiegensis]